MGMRILLRHPKRKRTVCFARAARVMDNFRGVGQGDRKVPDETPELRMKRLLKLGVVGVAACLALALTVSRRGPAMIQETVAPEAAVGLLASSALLCLFWNCGTIMT